MAKVTAPLFSLGASGKIGDAIVYFTWKGRNVVRQWLVPSNPQATDQGDRRIILGGTGRAVGKIVADSEFHDQLITLELIPGGQTKQSYLVKYIIDNYISNATNYSTELACMKAHGGSLDIGTAAEALNISEFDLDYATIDPYDKRLGIYLIGKAAVALSFTGTHYTKTFASWTSVQWNSVAEDFTA